jgi:1,5-anhydro-D-fructose reductase (1,5-anhydro-D-mannitol-forming)
VSIRIAQLGTWHLHAAHHVEAARAHPDTEVVAVWDRRPGEATVFGERHGLPVADDLAELLARDDVDAVMVDTATTDHDAVIAAALKAGKHVFAEKLLAVTAEGAQRLAALALDRGLALGVSLPRLAHQSTRTIRALVDAGELGDLTGYRMRWAHHAAVGTPWIPDHFFVRAEAGGGALIDLGAHPVYVAMHLFGRVPVSVQASIGHVSGREVDDNAVLTMDFGGVFAVAEVSMVASYFGTTLEVVGTGGSVVVEGLNGIPRVKRGADAEWVDAELAPAGDDPFTAWVARVQAGSADPEHLRTAVEVTRVLEAGYRAAAAGTTVPVLAR